MTKRREHDEVTLVSGNDNSLLQFVLTLKCADFNLANISAVNKVDQREQKP